MNNEPPTMPEDGDDTTAERRWIDRIVTPLNACSLETYNAPLKAPTSATASGERFVRGSSSPFVVAVVVGCYQLNEPEKGGGGDSSAADESVNPGDDDSDGGGGVENDSGKDRRGPTRSGELRLHMIPAIGPPNENYDAVSETNASASAGSAFHRSDPLAASEKRGASAPPSTLRFGRPAHIVEMESGVLDGKWRKPRGNPAAGSISEYNDDDNATLERTGRTEERGPREIPPLYASACASGRIHLHALNCRDDGDVDSDGPMPSSSSAWRLDHAASSPGASSDDECGAGALCLSLAWNQNVAAASPSSSDDAVESFFSDQIVSSYSNGEIAIHNVRYRRSGHADCAEDSVSMEEVQRWNAHTLFGCPAEVWTCCYVTGVENVVLSGADDCCLKVWDLRSTARPTHTIGSTEFEAGVTAVSPHPDIPHIFSVGSYDEFVRVYDDRMLDAGPLWKVNVGGGVWRIKWHPPGSLLAGGSAGDRGRSKIPSGRMLVAAMHGGCRVVDVPGLSDRFRNCSEEVFDRKEINVISEFTAHESMAYGADWILGASTATATVAASCSFYDRQAFIWDCN